MTAGRSETVTPPNPSPPTNFSSLGETPPTSPGLVPVSAVSSDTPHLFAPATGGLEHECAGTELVDPITGTVSTDGPPYVISPNSDHPSSGGAAEGETPDWVPAGAVIHIDLVGGDPQGRTWVAGTGEVAIAAVIADPSKIVAEGLRFDENSSGVAMLGALADAFLTVNWTIELVYMVFAGSPVSGVLFSIHSADGLDLVHATATPQGRVNVVQDWIDDWNDTGREILPSPTGSNTQDVPLTCRITRTNAKLSAKYMNEPEVSDTSVNFGFTPTIAEFGDSPGEFYKPGRLAIRSVTIFPPE